MNSERLAMPIALCFLFKDKQEFFADGTGEIMSQNAMRVVWCMRQ